MFNPDQSTMFPLKPLPVAVQEREHAIEKVEYNASEIWKTRIMETIVAICKRQKQFTADDIWDKFLQEDGEQTDPRALGAMIRKASKLGYCKAVGYAPSRRRHMSPVALWESLLL